MAEVTELAYPTALQFLEWLSTSVPRAIISISRFTYFSFLYGVFLQSGEQTGKISLERNQPTTIRSRRFYDRTVEVYFVSDFFANVPCS